MNFVCPTIDSIPNEIVPETKIMYMEIFNDNIPKIWAVGPTSAKNKVIVARERLNATVNEKVNGLASKARSLGEIGRGACRGRGVEVVEGWVGAG